ncbi:hypothetical protein M9Y10_041273 [Tritrichomonas musculus]|uniref:Uncharacterized protein n=1 Tax=Tritrichomonas musculus TaxID=1915356 RepID=A0ABR2K447_9EUKA
MTQRQVASSLEYTRSGSIINNNSSLSTSRLNISDPSSLELSFILHTIKGAHFSQQTACISVNGHAFVLTPRYKNNHQRFYGNGFLIYIPADEMVRFSVGIVTPEKNNKKISNKAGFLHGFVRYSIEPPKNPIVQELTMETIGGSYIINATIGITPSIKCRSPLTSLNPQKVPKRRRNISLLRRTVPAKTRRGPSPMNQKRSQTQVAQTRFQIKSDTNENERKDDETNENENNKQTKRSTSRLEPKRKTDEPTPFVTDTNNVE